jgi:hypothetical protein
LLRSNRESRNVPKNTLDSNSEEWRHFQTCFADLPERIFEKFSREFEANNFFLPGIDSR